VDKAGVGTLSAADVKGRSHWLPPAGWLPLPGYGVRPLVGKGWEATLGKERTRKVRRLERRTRQQLAHMVRRGRSPSPKR
jgi:hypothetical protein